jgi:O-antigen/teichoic acid export membrane protein
VLGAWFARGLLRFRRRGFAGEMRRAWDYGKFSLAGVVSYLFFSRADSFVLSAFTGPVQVAVYTSAKIFVRIYEMVTQVVQMFVLPVTSRLASRGEADDLRALVEKAIAFTTVATLPVMVLFLAGSTRVLDAVYHGRYAEAAPLLMVFSLLTFIVPAQAVASNVLLGLGKAREGFVIGAQTLALGLGAYFLLVPPLGALGAAIGYVVTSLVLAVLSVRIMNRTLPLTVGGVLGRTRDISNFVRNRMRKG